MLVSLHGAADGTWGEEIQHDGMVEPALCNPDLVDIGRLPQLGDDLLGCVRLPLNFPPLLDAIRPTARRATSMGAGHLSARLQTIPLEAAPP